MTSQVGHSLYVIPAGTPEKERLGKQYAFKRALSQWNSPIPPSLDVSGIANVLDIGAGTCVWTFDFANLPEVRSRLNIPGKEPSKGTNPVQLYACDIETKFFPDRALLDEFGVKTFQQDVTTPFPPKYHGKFDIVHLSFLFLCLTREGWTKALRNINQVLKPGGILFMDEVDPILYPNIAAIPDEDAPGHDLKTQLTRPDWLGKGNRMYTAHSIESGFVTDLTYRLPSMLNAAGFEVKESHRVYGLLGKHAADRPDLADFVEFSIENFVFVFRHLAKNLLAKDKLFTPDGTAVKTEEELEDMLREVEQGARREGAALIDTFFVAIKKS
ncbi:hypothetical protein PYCCODRAFT_1419298 [Trametes coccinea BRFM310]|uniref:Methyltransferase type 12 domain-containing protein n=1 Tax=Trametes coccinea (strain BRFM310) TaxID=1353009 RepID=A0A1Y2ICF2_TRAC3|nr:hypothetical protein PYCCODRAFT_1419298 [Trametes coccinea BRFM310]